MTLEYICTLCPAAKDDMILFDMLYYLYQWAQEQKFDNEQIKGAIEIASNSYEHVMSNTKSKEDEHLQYLKEQIYSKSINNPPDSKRIISAAQAEALYEYFSNTFVRMLKFYETYAELKTTSLK